MSIHTYIHASLHQVVVDAVLAVRKSEGQPIDLHMVEIMEMMHRTDTDTQYVLSTVVAACRHLHVVYKDTYIDDFFFVRNNFLMICP